MTKVTRIARNTSYFTFALILQKVIAFTYFAILARTFVPEDIGKYFFAISFTTISAIFIDLGLSKVLTREVAKNQEKVSRLLSSVIALKLPLAFVSLIGLIVINLLGYPTLTKQLVYLSSICMILDSFSITFFSCLRGFHNLKFESMASIFFQIIVFILGVTAIKFNLGLHYVMLALVFGSVFNLGFSLFLIKFKLRIQLIKAADPRLIKTIIRISVPFALFEIYQKLYIYIDIVLLSMLAGDKYVGLYQVAFKIIFALQFLPTAFAASLYPAFSKYWKENPKQLSITFEHAVNYLIIVSVPISVGMITLADKIILILRPEYLEAVPCLQIIMIALIFVFLNFPISSLLSACDQQKINTRNMAIALTTSIILNLILIPKYQAVGTSITVLVTNALMFALGIKATPSITRINFNKITSVLGKALLSGAIMANLVLYYKETIHIFALIIAAVILYFIGLIFLKAFKQEDIISI